MIDGIKCPPGCHKYRPLGKVLFCTGCADVQPLLLDIPDVPRGSIAEPPEEPAWPIDIDKPPQTIPVSDEAQMDMLRNLRDLVNQGGTPTPEQMDLLGQRHVYDGDMPDEEVINRSNELTWPKVRVDEGYRTDPLDDSIPSAGL